MHNSVHHDLQYLSMVEDILDHGHKKDDRTGVGTISTFGQMMAFDLKNGAIPLLTTKKVFFKGIIHELIWMLSGDTNIRYLKEHGVSIWDSWIKPETAEFGPMTETEMVKALTDYYRRKSYAQVKIEIMDDPQLESSWRYELDGEDGITVVIDRSRIVEAYTGITGKKPEKLIAGELPKIYQHQWRRWEDIRIVSAEEIESERLEERGYEVIGECAFDRWVVRREIDQIANVIERLKTNPDCRRLIVSAWNTAEIEEMALAPCHSLFQFYTRLRPWGEVLDDLVHEGFLDEYEELFKERRTDTPKDHTWVPAEDSEEGYRDEHYYRDSYAFAASKGVKTRALSCQLYQR